MRRRELWRRATGIAAVWFCLAGAGFLFEAHDIESPVVAAVAAGVGAAVVFALGALLMWGLERALDP